MSQKLIEVAGRPLEMFTAPASQAVAVVSWNSFAWLGPLGDLDVLAKVLGILLVIAYLIGQVLHIKIKRVELRAAREKLEQARKGGRDGAAS